MLKQKNNLFLSSLILLLGTLWIYINIFFTPFYIWSEGVYKPWIFLKGLVLFRDSMWNRAGFDLYLLAGFYKLFGMNVLNFQIFIFLTQAFIGLILFYLVSKKSLKLGLLSYSIYSLFTFLVFGSVNQPAEILLGLFVFLIFYFLWNFLDTRKKINLLLAGIFTGLSLITKQTSILIPISAFIILIFNFRAKSLKYVGYYLGGTFIPLMLYVLYFGFNHALYDLYFNTIYAPLFPYRQNAPAWGLDEGLRMVAFHVTILLPFLFLKLKNYSLYLKSLLALFVASLFITLLPTFWSYRLISVLPIFSIMVGLFFLEGLRLLKTKAQILSKGVVIVGFVLFILQFGSYLKENMNYIMDNGGYLKREFLLDSFSENEFKVVDWLKKNTAENERIFNISDNLILFYSNRLPQNKYDCSMCFGFYPLNQYYNTITTNPARVVIYDSNLPNDWPLLKNWKYLKFLRSNYNLVKSFDQYQIYVRKI